MHFTNSHGNRGEGIKAGTEPERNEPPHLISSMHIALFIVAPVTLCDFFSRYADRLFIKNTA